MSASANLLRHLGASGVNQRIVYDVADFMSWGLVDWYTAEFQTDEGNPGNSLDLVWHRAGSSFSICFHGNGVVNIVRSMWRPDYPPRQLSIADVKGLREAVEHPLAQEIIRPAIEVAE